MTLIKRFRVPKQPNLSIWFSIGIFLLVLAGILSYRIGRLSKDNLKNLATLNQVLPDFNRQSLGQLKHQINDLEAEFLALVYLFDPPEKEIKKDYDLSIYFIEELGEISQSLKLKAANIQINYPNLGFKETLPEEKEARYMLRQLYSLKDVVSSGMDCGINFISILPQAIESRGILDGMKIAKSRIEFTAPAPALIEFMIQMSEIVPLTSIEFLHIESQDSSFKVEMILSCTVIEVDYKDSRIPFTPLNIKDILSEQEKFVNTLRSGNPFSVAKPQEFTQVQAAKALEQLKKQLPRFLYRGKAVLKSKEVAVIEDTLYQETLFVAPQENLGSFILQELEESQIVLKNINNNQQIIIKRGEE